MRLSVLCTALGLFFISEVEAQKKCTKGIPCGNTCIAANKTCRIGTSSTTPETTPKPLATTAPATGTTARAPLDIPAGDSTWGWTAARSGDVYYANVQSCVYLQRVQAGQRIYFRTSKEAEAYGLTRSLNSGC